MSRSDGPSRLLLVSVLLLLIVQAVASALQTPAYSYAASPSPDVVMAGGLDGRVYAVNAWSGQVLWSFDSGGPMVDSSQCLRASSREMPPATARERVEADVDVDGSVHVASSEEVEDRSVLQQQAASAQAMAASAAFMSQLVPSYDGRLYHFSNSKVKELGMTMGDIVNMNGPVRVAVDPTATVTGPSVDGAATDILLFGEKKLEMFKLDAASGFRRPYSSSAAATAMPSEIIFGRSEFTTRAVHSRNVSSARCFKISEFFLDFAQQAHCSVGDGGHNMVPEILVMPKDPNSALNDEGSTIVAFDPWTKEQLWEFQIPDFDVLAVYGVSITRGATFYKWKVDGPSSTASRRVRTPVQVAAGEFSQHHNHIEANSAQQESMDKNQEQVKHERRADKEVVPVVPRTWDAMESRFRLRLLGDHYFLESSEDDGVTDHGGEHVKYGNAPTFQRRQPNEIRDLHLHVHEELGAHRRRQIFWEPIVNDGKQGVFITYTHVGAMLLGVATCGILLAWGCYVKGLSTSLAQSAIKTMDQSQFFTSHVHRLTIQRPGEEDITISSVISRSLMMNTVGVDGPVPLLENGEHVNFLSTEVRASIDPATEGMLMENFSRLAANEAAAILLNGGHVGGKQKRLECDPDADSNATTATTSSSSLSFTDMIVGDISTSFSTVRLSGHGSSAGGRLTLSYAGDKSLTEDDVSDVYEVKMLPVGEDNAEFLSPAIDDVFDNGRFELADSDDDIFVEEEESGTTLNGAKSISSSGESTTGSCCSDSSSSHAASKFSRSADFNSLDHEDETTDEKSSDAKSSALESSEVSSSDSDASPHEVEALFPFVCQSRFLNEFEELSAIGKGGFGQVMLAENRLDGRKYAIKRVGLNLKNQTSKTLQKFLREVKILALLDHPNIVRYYQAWLEKVEENEKGASLPPSSVASDASSNGGLVNARNYSTSNLLAPISELEFSGNQRQLETFYSNGSMISTNDDDDGFDWERGSSSGVEDVWKEEDLVVQNKPRSRNLPSQVASSRSPGGLGNDEDSSLNATEKCDHWLYIQMQFCAGRNLGDYLAVPTRPMELSRMLKIFVQISSALAHVHSCGLIHRDLKPANIFVADTERDEIKLGDFGLSRYAANVNNLNTSTTLDDSQQGVPSGGLRDTPLSTSMWSNMSESNEVTAGVGTYLYASPEQVAGKKYNAKTDLYSLGMILFELCHDRFGTTMERYVTLRDARDSKFPTNLRAAKRCPEILAMLRKLLCHDPSTRPAAEEVVQWAQMMYETSLAQKAMEVVRSPRNLDMARAHLIPDIEHLMDGTSIENVMATTFSLKVEAMKENSTGEEGGERRLPNHDLLKQVCDVIASVSSGKVEIKKCGLHMESEGVTILEFELDPQAVLKDAPGSDVEGSVVVAIEALVGVQIVHRVSKID